MCQQPAGALGNWALADHRAQACHTGLGLAAMRASSMDHPVLDQGRINMKADDREDNQ
jgi:hypothetical protein